MPLAPTISPKKTVEGAIGGMVFGTAAMIVVGRMVFAASPIGLLALLGATIVALGIVGDLFESLLKRSAGVKDSSALIPGHGGVLDRIDSWLFAAPAYYVFVRYLLLMKSIAILGSTGSIGQSALAVVDAHPDRLRVVALAAGGNVEKFAEQVRRYRPACAAMATTTALDGCVRGDEGCRRRVASEPVCGRRRADCGRDASRRRHRALRLVGHRGARRRACAPSTPERPSRSRTRRFSSWPARS